MAGSNYDAIVDGIQKRLRTIGALKQVLDYEPAAVTAAPLVYVIFKDLAAVPQSSGEMALGYTLAARLLILYTNNEQAEQQVRTLVPQILNTLGGDLDAGGTIADGQVLVTRATGGYVTIASTRFRAVDFELEVIERVLFPYAL